MKLLLILGTIFCLASGQGENKAKLKRLVVISDIKVRYARTMVSAEYYNDKNSPTLADFSVILPKTAYISNFTMDIDGNVTIGEVKEKEEAKRIFTEAVQRGDSAGHVTAEHRDSQQFDMSVNVEPNVRVVFNLTYEELLKRTQGKYTHKIFLSNNEIIDDVLVEVFISEPQEIKVLDEQISHEECNVRSVDYLDNNHVYIRFDPSVDEQRARIEKGCDGEFIVEYDVNRTDSNVIYTLDGYFVHFFSLDNEPIWPKNVVFMIDVSGSMYGGKLQAVKDALRSILSSLDHKKDSFNIGTFESTVKWQHSQNFEEAEQFIDSLQANGGTNIYDALTSSLVKLGEKSQSNTADILFFLTDGLASVGISNTTTIRQDIKQSNVDNAMIYSLGFGQDCDHQFLKDLSSENNGASRKIYVAEDSAEQIQDMFKEISDLLLKHIIITYVDSSIDVGNLTRNEFKTFFKGSEIAIAGPINEGTNKSRTITTVIKAVSAQKAFERKEELKFVDLDEDNFLILGDIPQSPNLTKLGLLSDITKQTWAYLTLKKMFHDKDPPEDLIAMAIKHNFVTSLTSMVVTKAKLQGEVTVDGIKEDVQPSLDLNRQNIFNRRVHHSRKIDGQPSFDLNVQPSFDLSVHHSRKIDVQPSFDLNVQPSFDLSVYNWVGKAPIDIPATTTTTPATTTTTPATTTTTPATTTTTLPMLPRLPAIIVKPYKCALMLCVSRETDCFPDSKVLLLKDSRAGVEIYGYPKKNTTGNCMDNLYKITLKSRRNNIEITPSSARVNGKTYDTSKRTQIRFKYKRFFFLTVFFNRSVQRETISVKFTLIDYLNTSRGFYGEYMKKFDCHIQPSGELRLSHMPRVFRKFGFTSPEKGFDQCYM